MRRLGSIVFLKKCLIGGGAKPRKGNMLVQKSKKKCKNLEYSQKHVRLSQSLSKDHLSALVSSNVMSPVAVECLRQGV